MKAKTKAKTKAKMKKKSGRGASSEATRSINFRVPKSWVGKVDALRKSSLVPVEVSRTAMFRFALGHGLEMLMTGKIMKGKGRDKSATRPGHSSSSRTRRSTTRRETRR
jgi:hypothetical protein